jgi:prepilin-type N-terminal cleavage/methylation domain-containing protein
MHSKVGLVDRGFRAFTLIELLVTIAIVAVLAGLILGGSAIVRKRGQQAASLNNIRQIGIAFQQYANDNDTRFPAHILSGDKWPRLLQDYLNDQRVYADPTDRANYLLRKSDPLSNGANNTSFIMNGFNDVGAFQDQSVTVKTVALDSPANTIILAPMSRHAGFYMDLDTNDQKNTVNSRQYPQGSYYAFADGSARFVNIADYRDELWMVHKPQRN